MILFLFNFANVISFKNGQNEHKIRLSFIEKIVAFLGEKLSKSF